MAGSQDTENRIVTRTEVKKMQKDIDDINAKLDKMPDVIIGRINETMDLKIQIAIGNLEKKYLLKFIAMLLGLFSEGAGLIFALVKIAFLSK